MSYKSIIQGLRFRIGDTTKVGFSYSFGLDTKEYEKKLKDFPDYRHYVYELVSYKRIKRRIIDDIYCHVRSISGECGIDVLIKHDGLRPLRLLEFGYAHPIPTCITGSNIEITSYGNSYPKFYKAREILGAPETNNYNDFKDLEEHKFIVVGSFFDSSEGFIYYVKSDRDCHIIIGQEGIKPKLNETT